MPIITYPIYPLCAISKSNILSLQRIQNKALRFVHEERYPYTKTTEEMHQLSNLNALNVTLYTRGNKIRQKMLNLLRDETYTTITTDNNENSHSWFKKPYIELSKYPPDPMYTTI